MRRSNVKHPQIQFKQKTAAQILGISPRSLQNYTKKGLIHKNAAGFYSKEALHKFANSKQIKNDAPVKNT